jgi:oligopeptide transport system ATP-binding protein
MILASPRQEGSELVMEQAGQGRPPLLEIEALKKYFPIRKGLMGKTVGHVYAVDDVSLKIRRGETLGLVGESGCGKSTLGRCILRLHEPTGGRILLDGQDILSLKSQELRKVRTQFQMIFQDPYASLNPRLRVREIVGESLRVHGMAGTDSWVDMVGELLKKVGLQPDHMQRYPHEFSGGQRQRIGIARALALSPRLIIADEPVSALDVSIRAQVINLLDSLKAEYGLSYLFISHDLAVVEHMADYIAVMYLGKIVEVGSDRDLYQYPLHPYTKALLAAIPNPDSAEKRRRKDILSGDVPSPINPPQGCRFHTRCPHVMEHCMRQEPPWVEVKEGHRVACFLYG